MAIMLKKIILFVLMLSVPAMVLAASDQSTGLIFVGKIEEIAIKSAISPVDMGPVERSLAIKLDSKPNLDIRLSAKDAARYGLIDTARPSMVLTPSQVKGVGWKVRLTCDRKTVFGGEPIYMVVKLEKLN
jgi:hypothetical protein